MKLTKNEIQMLSAIVKSEYHDGQSPVDNWVWFENPFADKQTAGGVCSSLTEKGLALFCDMGTRNHTMAITRAGYAAFVMSKALARTGA